jgi:hypothetical protein
VGNSDFSRHLEYVIIYVFNIFFNKKYIKKIKKHYYYNIKLNAILI